MDISLCLDSVKALGLTAVERSRSDKDLSRGNCIDKRITESFPAYMMNARLAQLVGP